jgi:hypothetical protein
VADLVAVVEEAAVAGISADLIRGSLMAQFSGWVATQR